MKFSFTLLVLFSLVGLQLFGQGDTLFQTKAFDGVDRNYILYVPDAYDGSQAWPLVINMHGYATNAESQMVHSNMNVVADTGHFLVVYPEGTLVRSTVPGIPPEGLGFNISFPNDTFLFVSNVDDVSFIDQLIDVVDSEYELDMNRIYATGWSNGGMMSNVLACELSDRIAAIAPVGGTAISARPCNPSRSVPLMQIHGTSDPVVGYDIGDPTGNVSPVEEYLQFWTGFNGCNTEPTITMLPDVTTEDSSTVELQVWNDCDVEMLHYKVIDGGHNWPGGNNIFPFLGNFNVDINASSDIWDFFTRNPLPMPTARVQFIHAAPDETVALEINGEVIKEEVAYRTATPYLELPAETVLDLVLTPVSPWSNSLPINVSLTLASGESYVVAVHGTFDEGDQWPVSVEILEGAQETAADGNSVALSFFQGVPDFPLPAFDIVYDGSVLFDDNSYTDFQAHVEVPAGDLLTFGTPPDDNETISSAFVLPLSFWKGKSAVMFNSGLFSENDFFPWIALSNGGTYPVKIPEMVQGTDPAGSPSLFQTSGLANSYPKVYPNPFTDEITLEFELKESLPVRLELVNLLEQQVAQLPQQIMPKGKQRVVWNLSGQNLSGGMYYLNYYVGQKKMIMPILYTPN